VSRKYPLLVPHRGQCGRTQPDMLATILASSRRPAAPSLSVVMLRTAIDVCDSSEGPPSRGVPVLVVDPDLCDLPHISSAFSGPRCLSVGRGSHLEIPAVRPRFHYLTEGAPDPAVRRALLAAARSSGCHCAAACFGVRLYLDGLSSCCLGSFTTTIPLPELRVPLSGSTLTGRRPSSSTW